MNIKEDINLNTNLNHTCSQGWSNMTKNLKKYLEENNNLMNYKINEIHPHIFHWPQRSGQNIGQLSILEKDHNCIFYKSIIKTNDYGPSGIELYNNIQLDRVQQAWSLYNLVNILNLNLNNDEIIFEFGGGTGQMADVLVDLNFKGKHIVYDLPLVNIIQRYFTKKRNIESAYILDDKDINIQQGLSYLPCNQIKSEKTIMELPNINFIATYSLSETDMVTHERFAKYMSNFARIIIIYSLNQTVTEDYIDNELYIQNIKEDIIESHYCYNDSNFGNGKIFIAIKKELMSHENFMRRVS